MQHDDEESSESDYSAYSISAHFHNPPTITTDSTSPLNSPSSSSNIPNPRTATSRILPNPQVTCVGISSFHLWLQHKLSRKYFFHLDRLLMAVKPTLLLLREIRTTLEQIGLMITMTDSESSKKDLANNNNNVTMSVLETKGLQPYIDNSIHIIDAIATEFPVFLDSEYLLHFQKQVREIVRLVTVNLHPFSHLEPDHLSIKKQVQRKINRISRLLDSVPKYLQNIQDIMEKQLPVLDKFDHLKEILVDPLKDIVAEYDRLGELERHHRVEMAQATHRYNAAKQKYNHYMKDHRLGKAVKLEFECSTALLQLADMMGPLAKICQNLNSKKWVMGEETQGLDPEDVIRIKKYSSVAVKGNLLEELFVSSPEELLECLDSIRVTAEQAPSILGLSKKNQAAVLEYCKTFDRGLFLQTFNHVKQKSKQLHKLQEDPEFTKKQKDFQEVATVHDQAKTNFEATQLEFLKAVDTYREFMDRWNSIRFTVAKCCLLEFQELVELTLPPRP